MDKLEELKRKIQEYKEKNKHKKDQKDKKKQFIVGSFNVALEIVGASAVGILMGFYLDKFFGLKFFFKIVCLILAFIASIVNIYRTIDKH